MFHDIQKMKTNQYFSFSEQLLIHGLHFGIVIYI